MMQKIFFYILLVVYAVVPSLVSAQLPGGTPITLEDIFNLLQGTANFLIRASLFAAIILIVWAGIIYMSAGSDPTKVKNAQARLKTAIIGTFIVFMVGVILNTLQSVANRSFFGGGTP